MSQTQTSKAAAADERTEAARSFVRTVKAAARRKYTPGKDAAYRRPRRGIRIRAPWSVHRAPNHISKVVLPTIHLGPPNWTKSRTFTLRFALDL